MYIMCVPYVCTIRCRVCRDDGVVRIEIQIISSEGSANDVSTPQTLFNWRMRVVADWLMQ